jgi:hypothetical protein
VLGGRERVDAVGLPRGTLRSPRTLDLEDGVTGLSQVFAQTGAPAAGTLDAKDELPCVAEDFGSALQLGIAGRRRPERELAEQLTEEIKAVA